MPVTLYATMTALDGKKEVVSDLLLRLKIDVDNEPGNDRFVVYTLRDKPDHFHVEETYRDADAFAAHMASFHCIAFNKTIVDLVANGASDVVFLDPI